MGNIRDLFLYLTKEVCGFVYFKTSSDFQHVTLKFSQERACDTYFADSIHTVTNAKL